MAAGIPLYVCATASVPIAAGLIHLGASPGAALAFLIVGAATNPAAVTTVWKVLGRRTTVVYLVTVGLSALLCGLVLDALSSWLVHWLPQVASYTPAACCAGHRCRAGRVLVESVGRAPHGRAPGIETADRRQEGQACGSAGPGARARGRTCVLPPRSAAAPVKFGVRPGHRRAPRAAWSAWSSPFSFCRRAAFCLLLFARICDAFPSDPRPACRAGERVL